jgi:DNA-binding NtrC family response regulator
MEALRKKIQQLAATDARVLIRGESGSGKELVADALHRQSGRREGPFVKLNCAAIPAHLVEDELFGHAVGAFTDAKTAKVGLFEEADGGTLFLDEIGDMDVALQARLLRILEDGQVRRLGESRNRQVDVRVLAATHADLEQAVQEGRFREDLYFRLAPLPLEVPPLRQRGEDVRRLFDHFLEGYCRRHRTRLLAVDGEVYRRLEHHGWPGNVRELKALAERLSIFGVDPLTAEQLPPSLGPAATESGGTLLRFAAGDPVLPLKDFRSRCEKEYIEAVLRQTGWNVSATARLLGLGRTHLHQKMHELGTKRPGSED